METTANVQETLDMLQNAMKASEAAMAAVPGVYYVLLWGDHPLKHTGSTMSLCGEAIWRNVSHANALEKAALWRDTLAKANNPELNTPVRVVTAARALDIIRKRNADLLKVIPAYMNQGA